MSPVRTNLSAVPDVPTGPLPTIELQRLAFIATLPEKSRIPLCEQMAEDLAAGKRALGLLSFPKRDPSVHYYEMSDHRFDLARLFDDMKRRQLDLAIINSWYNLYLRREDSDKLLGELGMIGRCRLDAPCPMVVLCSHSRTRTDAGYVVKAITGRGHSFLPEMADVRCYLWPTKLHVITSRVEYQSFLIRSEPRIEVIGWAPYQKKGTSQRDERIRAMAADGKTQEEIGAKLGLSQPTISKILKKASRTDVT